MIGFLIGLVVMYFVCGFAVKSIIEGVHVSFGNLLVIDTKWDLFLTLLIWPRFVFEAVVDVEIAQRQREDRELGQYGELDADEEVPDEDGLN